MKLLKYLIFSSIVVSSTYATTVNLSLDPSVVFTGEDSQILGGSDSVQVGFFTSWTFGSELTDLGTMGFQEFDPSGNTYGFPLNGWLAGGGSQNGTAASFNQEQIWVVINDNDGGFGVFSGVEDSVDWSFPNDGNGTNDTLNVVYGSGGITRLAGLTAVAGGFQVSPVPEPSAYAALAGCLALGWVMVRRRRA